MALTAASFVSPAGRLSRTMFPQDAAGDFTARLEAYLSDASTRVAAAGIPSDSVDVAVAHWVYHRAFEAIYLDMARTPANQTKNDEGSKSTLAMQITEYKQKAADALGAYQALVPVTVPVAGVVPDSTPASTSQAMRIAW